MNRKIPFPELSARLALACGLSQEEAETFVKEFFDLITATLVAGESIQVKGLGTFAATGDSPSAVTFTADEALALAVNAPFAMFEPEAVSDSLPTSELEETAGTPVHETETMPEPEPEQATQAPNAEPLVEYEEPVQETQPDEEAIEAADQQNTVEPDNSDLSGSSAQSDPAATATTATAAACSIVDNEDEEEYLPEPTSPQRQGAGFGWGFAIGLLVGLALGACTVYLAIDKLFPPSDITELLEQETHGIEQEITAEEAVINELASSHEQPQASDSTALAAPSPVQETAPAAQPQQAAQEPQDTPGKTADATVTVKDTIRPGYLLNDMAKKHYGNKCFWVYIYRENQAKIKNPNRVSPGLEVVIPPASKYGIDSRDPSSIKQANALAGKILTQYPH